MERRVRRVSDGMVVLGALGLIGQGALLGAAGSTQPAETLVGITTIGENNDTLVRMWSDGRCEYARVSQSAPRRMMESWKPFASGR